MQSGATFWERSPPHPHPNTFYKKGKGIQSAVLQKAVGCLKYAHNPLFKRFERGVGRTFGKVLPNKKGEERWKLIRENLLNFCRVRAC